MITMARAVIYTAHKCPHSLKLKEFLKETGIEFEEKCVLDNLDAFEEIFKATEQKGIPVTNIDGDFFVGFDRRTQRRIKRKVGA